MQDIQILPSDVIDQIAAGEVVERPAHLVKELIENSLDAQAQAIQIEFSDGGRFVRITDDGVGIQAHQLGSALERHATSKIKASDDLWALKSFGFRGEALASIAAVSDLQILSRTKEASTGSRLISQFGKQGTLELVSATPGTSVSVDRLFENVPARLKFLKSPAAEAAKIKQVIKALALAHPQVEFRVHQDHKLLHFWPKGQSYQERAEAVLEMQLYAAVNTGSDIRVQAFFTDPHQVQKTSKDIWLFAQSRWIQDRSVQTAVMEAYRNLLMHGEFPSAVVFVTVPLDQVDVNIHPTKSQVKFLDPASVFRAVQSTIRLGLEKAPWIQGQSSSPYPLSTAAASEQPSNDSPIEQAVLQFAEAELTKPAFFKQKEWDYRKSSETSTASSSPSPNYQHGFQRASPQGAETPTSAPAKYWSNLQVLGQSKLTYILSQSAEALVIVDQHAAHERVMFEKLMAAWRGRAIETQDFLFPLAIDLSIEKTEAILSQKANFQKLGIQIEALGPETVGITSSPIILKESALQKVIEQTAHELIEYGDSFSFEKQLGDLFATMACHSAIRAGQAMSLEEMQALLQQMDEFPLSSFCPHGRPVSVNYSFYQLEKDFGRTL